jgi:hypothetical protein
MAKGPIYARSLEEAETKQLQAVKLSDPKWIRGVCPQCGGGLLSNLYYIEGRGYLMVMECAESLSERPACNYRRC